MEREGPFPSLPSVEHEERPPLKEKRRRGGVEKGWRGGGSRYKKSSRIKSRGCTLVKGDVVGVRLA